MIVGETDHSIGANHQSIVVFPIRNLCDALELTTLYDAVPIHNSRLLLSLVCEIIEVSRVAASAAEATIILKPVDTSDDGVSFALHIQWAFSGVKVEDVNTLVESARCKQVSSVAKPNLLAIFHLHRIVLFDRL